MTLTSLKKFLVVLFIFATSTSFAVESFKVPVPRLRVYSQASTLSQVLTILTQGQVVQAGSNPGGGFKKVLVTDSTGKKRVGYVALSDIPAAAKTAAKNNRSRASSTSSGDGLHNHSVIGILGGVAYDTGQRALTDATNTTYTTTSLSGIAPQFGGFFDFSWSQRVNIDTYLMYKSASVSGGTYTTNQGVTVPVTINQSFISAGVLGEFYLDKDGSWWFGPGIQVDFGLSASATLASTTLSLSSNQFILLYAAIGYDFGITQNVYLTPEISFGADVNSSPMLLEGNFLIKLGYRL